MNRIVTVTTDELRQLIREEFARLSARDTGNDELTVEEFAQFMHWSPAYTRQRLAEVPHEKVGKRVFILRKNAEQFRLSLRR